MAEGAVHAQTRQTNRPNERRENFQKRKLETVVLKIKGSGREFTGLVPENAGVNERIERIVKQNGGEIKKKYYDEMGTHQITEISIGDQLLTKIHWGIEGGKIPIAVDKEGNIKGFLNGEEIKSTKIDLWEEESTMDPKRIKDLKGNMRKVEGAHATPREEKPDLKNNEIILFDKETGELSPFSENTKVESFDWDIKVEKLFIPQVLPVEKIYSHRMFDGFSSEMQGNFYYTYIEIMDSKESLTDRVTVIPLASQKFDGHPLSNAEPAIQEYPKPCAGETFFHDHKTDIQPSSMTRPAEFTGEHPPARKIVFREVPYTYATTKIKSIGGVKTGPLKIKSERQEKREISFCRQQPKIDKPQLAEKLKTKYVAVKEIYIEREPVKDTEYGKKDARLMEKIGAAKMKKKKRKRIDPKINAETRKFKIKVRKMLKNKTQKKKADNKMSVPEARKKERMKKLIPQSKNEVVKREKRKCAKKPLMDKQKIKKKKKAKAPGPKDEIKRGFKKPVKKTEKARRLRRLLERKKKIEKYLLTGYF